MTVETYITQKALSYSDLNTFSQSPLHYKHFAENPQEPTKSMEFGILFKLAVLDPAAFKDQYYMVPVSDKRTVAGKAEALKAEQANEGKTGIAMEMYQAIMQMRENVYSNGKANKLLNCEHRKYFTWNDPETLVACKGKVSIIKDRSWIAEIVTTQNADPNHFWEDIIKYNYHRKAAFQLDAAKQKSQSYYLIVVEKQAPFAVNVLKMPTEIISQGRREYKDLLKRYSICELTDNWPGYECKDSEAIIRRKLGLKVKV
jgi:hypothetical protein